MKIVKIAGLLLAGLLCNNLQSMELPDEYPLEGRLLNGDISFEQYLEIFEETSGYGWMLKDLRTAQYTNPSYNLYPILISLIRGRLFQSQQWLFRTWDRQSMPMKEEEALEMASKQVYDSVIQRILRSHELLMCLIESGDA